MIYKKWNQKINLNMYQEMCICKNMNKYINKLN